MAFQEPRRRDARADFAAALPTETYRRAGMDLFMGLRLRSIFREAGLPAPEMHLDAAVGGGPDWPGYEYMARLMRTILPQITKLGGATEEDLRIDTLADRLRAEIGDRGAAVTWGFITAWLNARPVPDQRAWRYSTNA